MVLAARHEHEHHACPTPSSRSMGPPIRCAEAMGGGGPMKNANQVRLDPSCGLAIAAHRRYRRDYPPSYCQQPDFRRTTYDPSTGIVTLHTKHRVLAMYQEGSSGWLYPYPKPPRGS